jgi:hypothetical protein
MLCLDEVNKRIMGGFTGEALDRAYCLIYALCGWLYTVLTQGSLYDLPGQPKSSHDRPIVRGMWSPCMGAIDAVASIDQKDQIIERSGSMGDVWLSCVIIIQGHTPGVVLRVLHKAPPEACQQPV